MAYFANGSEGGILDNQCGECIHGTDRVEMCPVYFVQANYNYKQSDNKDLTDCLNYLVDDHGICQMKKAMESINLLTPVESDERSELEKWEAERV